MSCASLWLALTAPASRERVAPIVFRPPRPPQRGCRVGGPGAGASRRTRALGAEDGRKRIGDRTRRAASTQVWTYWMFRRTVGEDAGAEWPDARATRVPVGFCGT